MVSSPYLPFPPLPPFLGYYKEEIHGCQEGGSGGSLGLSSF